MKKKAPAKKGKRMAMGGMTNAAMSDKMARGPKLPPQTNYPGIERPGRGNEGMGGNVAIGRPAPMPRPGLPKPGTPIVNDPGFSLDLPPGLGGRAPRPRPTRPGMPQSMPGTMKGGGLVKGAGCAKLKATAKKPAKRMAMGGYTGPAGTNQGAWSGGGRSLGVTTGTTTGTMASNRPAGGRGASGPAIQTMFAKFAKKPNKGQALASPLAYEGMDIMFKRPESGTNWPGQGRGTQFSVDTTYPGGYGMPGLASNATRKGMKGGGLARKGVGQALKTGGLVKGGGCITHGVKPAKVR